MGLSVSFSRPPSSLGAVTGAASAVAIDGIEGVRGVGFEVGAVSWVCGGVGTWLSRRRVLEGAGTAASCSNAVAVVGGCTASFIEGVMAADSCLAEVAGGAESFGGGMGAESCLGAAGFSIAGVGWTSGAAGDSTSTDGMGTL